ncbi:MAG: Phenylalanine-tRNA ligase alpha subunit [Parcubacteria group bacterium GW2011_GWA2_38_13]|nr:MAG: Phenylalanine-tRNA ligase alpha subunit [Parcubacteria group bacterium GW2011_GWA2_38_13]
MEEKLHQLKNDFIAKLSQAKTAEEARNFEIEFLGRKGKLTAILRSIAGLPDADRPKAGQMANTIKLEMELAMKDRMDAMEKSSDTAGIDATLPGIIPQTGHLHLVTQAIREINTIFEKIGFYTVSYPEVEWDWYAFESLNMPKEHPARDEWETFFIDKLPVGPKGLRILTPHTSSGQVREMEKKQFPIRMINISKCYRRQIDVSHVPMFHQFEGLMIDKGVNITHLKGVLDYFAKSFFGPNRVARIRPYHFQFTEPSFEVDISCGVCLGKGCNLCKEGWLELGGAGMVHPNVLKAGKIDPKKYSGFAFGWGVERTCMMKAGLQLPDIRILYQNDLRFLQQF